MNINQMKYFLSVAEYLSFTKAANHHFISQPALSRQIAAMELELGVSLFQRGKNYIRLTQAGELLYSRFSALIDEYNKAVEKALSIKVEKYGSLKIGKSTNFTFDEAIIQAISEFADLYSEDTFSICSLPNVELGEQINDGELDIAFAYFDYASKETLAENTDYHILSSEKLFVAVSKASELATEDSLSIDSLRNHTLIAMDLPQGKRDDFDRHNTSKQLFFHNNPNPRIKTAKDVDSLITLVESGVGFTFVPAQHPLCRSPLIKLFCAPDDTVHSRVVYWNTDNNNPALNSFLDIVTDSCNSMDPHSRSTAEN